MMQVQVHLALALGSVTNPRVLSITRKKFELLSYLGARRKNRPYLHPH